MITEHDAQLIARALMPLLEKALLEKMQDDAKEDKILSTQDVANILHRSVSYVRKHLDEIPHRKRNRRIEFLQSQIQNYINEN